jgi:hypothetical protein
MVRGERLSRFFLRVRDLARSSSGVISGAAATTIILGVQTYILYRQTNLIGKQTEALSLDQAAHLRDHISAASTVESTTQRLTTRLNSLQNVTFSTDVPGGHPFTVSSYVVDACSSSDCSNAPFDSALRSIKEDKPVLDDSLSSAALRIAFILANWIGPCQRSSKAANKCVLMGR